MEIHWQRCMPDQHYSHHVSSNFYQKRHPRSDHNQHRPYSRTVLKIGKLVHFIGTAGSFERPHMSFRGSDGILEKSRLRQTGATQRPMRINHFTDCIHSPLGIDRFEYSKLQEIHLDVGNMSTEKSFGL